MSPNAFPDKSGIWSHLVARAPFSFHLWSGVASATWSVGRPLLKHLRTAPFAILSAKRLCSAQRVSQFGSVILASSRGLARLRGLVEP